VDQERRFKMSDIRELAESFDHNSALRVRLIPELSRQHLVHLQSHAEELKSWVTIKAFFPMMRVGSFA
jgi:hypothetical protein